MQPYTCLCNRATVTVTVGHICKDHMHHILSTHVQLYVIYDFVIANTIYMFYYIAHITLTLILALLYSHAEVLCFMHT